MSWEAPLVPLADHRYFKTLNGLWTGKKPPFVRAGVIRNTNFTASGLVDYSNIAYLDVEERQLASRRLAPGDIVIERSGGGPKQPVGRVVYFDRLDGAFSFSNFTSAIRVKDREAFDPQFVFYGLLEFYQSGETERIQSHTTGIRNLDFTAYKERALLPRIPILEQRKIATVLNLVQRVIGQQERSIALTEEIKSSMLEFLFSTGIRRAQERETLYGNVPEAWSVKPLGECCVIQTGLAKGRKVEMSEGLTVPYLRVANVQDGYLDLSEIKTITIRSREKERFLLRVDDVLLTEGGDLDKLGRGFIWQGQIPDCIHQNHVFAVRVDRDVLLPKFFALLLQSPYGKAYFLSVAHKTTNLATINTNKLRAFPVLIPSMEEQERIVEALDAADGRLSLMRHKRTLLTELFRTLLHQLMTAQVRIADIDLSVITDTVDEEAAVLA